MSFRRPLPSNKVPIVSFLDWSETSAIEIWKPDKFVGNEHPMIMISYPPRTDVLTAEQVEVLIVQLQTAVALAKELDK